METHCIPAAQVPYFSSKDLAYTYAEPALRPFYKYEAKRESFEAAIRDKQADATDRALLVRVLQAQYARLEMSEQTRANLEKLALPNAFTVTTAHQPALFTGPLYYVYKILNVIQLARQLETAFPGFHFVPVFVSGAEDHDFEEINHAHLFGKTLRWEHSWGGPTGLYPTDTLQPLLEELEPLLAHTEHGRSAFQTIHAAYTGKETYGAAAIDLVNRLFGQYGLVALDMQHAELKRHFIPFMREELFHQPSQALVERTQQQLEAAGYSGQAHAREINLFYLEPGRRSRIVRTQDGFEILGSGKTFSPAALEEELTQHPERFSPNVVLRPLYQEHILPNLAYIGGGGEIAYWLERKTQFEHFGLNFPILIRRNSVLWVDAAACQRMEKLGVRVEALMGDAETMVRHFVESRSTDELSLSREMEALREIFYSIRDKALRIDPTLEKVVGAEESKQLKGFEHLEQRLLRAEKQKYDTEVQQLRNLKEKLFPGNGLQERHDNFLVFYQKYGPAFFDTLLQHLDPFQTGLWVFTEK